MALTLRLDDDELAALESIKSSMGVATSTAAIKQMILTYSDTQERLSSLSAAFSDNSRESSLLKERLSNFFDSFFILSSSFDSSFKSESFISKGK